MEVQNHKATVSTEFHCVECRREWIDESERWRMYVLFGDEPEQGLYCPLCASFEFDE